MQKRLLTYFLMTLLFSHRLFGEACKDWFIESKIKVDKNCLLKCASYPVDMGTYMCHSNCDSLCHSDGYESWKFQVSDLYSSLTDEERALVALDPSKAFTAYMLSVKAEGQCLTIYEESSTNDESDACRHFIWSALLYKEFGIEYSNKVLNAHEAEPDQDISERSMDLANNRLGQSAAVELLKNNKFNETALLEFYKNYLKENRLIILSPRKNIRGLK